MNLLFVCSRNRLRSPTAEAVFASYRGVETDSAGLAPDADAMLDADQLAWADLICVMERRHKAKLSARWREMLRGKRIVVLDIPDDYRFMDPVLVDRLKTAVEPLLR